MCVYVYVFACVCVRVFVCVCVYACVRACVCQVGKEGGVAVAVGNAVPSLKEAATGDISQKSQFTTSNIYRADI